MALTDLDRRILWAKAGGTCSYRFGSELCGQPVIIDGPEGSINVGEECHIVGNRPGAARYIEHYPERDSYTNRILVCRNHHKVLDDPNHEQVYSVEVLQTMKLEHETAIQKARQDLSLGASRLPRLALMLFAVDDQRRHPQRELTFSYPNGSSSHCHAFGFRLENLEESTVAQRIAITVTAWWGGGEELRVAPEFEVPQKSNWQEQHRRLVCSHPAVLVFQDRELMCFYGQPITWDGFSVRYGTPWNGHVDVFYDIRSVEPYTESNGTLKMTTREEASWSSWR